MTRAFLAALVGLTAYGIQPGAALAYDVYDGCAAPGAATHVWFIDGAHGSSPDAAHGGYAVNGVTGTADGSSAHPFNSLYGLLHGGRYESSPVPGYGRPLLSTAPWDHYPYTGVNGQRKDHDWNPANPDPTRVNPGDMVVVRPGDYGTLNIGYYGQTTANVDGNGGTSFVQIVGEANAKLTSLAISSSRGFVVDGFTVKSQGPFSAVLVNVTGAGSTPTKDIVLFGLNVESFDDYADLDKAYASYQASTTDKPPKSEQQFMAANFKRGVYIGGDTTAGDHMTCVAVSGSRLHHMYTAFGVQGANKVLVSDNHIDHFTGDGSDLLSSGLRFVRNVFTSALDDASGAHPDTFQSQSSGMYKPDVYRDVVIQENVSIERLDPDARWMQHITFAQVAAVSGLVVTGNLAQISNCPGIALGPPTKGATISFNTIIGNGAIPVPSCPAVQSGEAAGTDNNTWSNNVVAGRFYQICNTSKWENNVQIPSRQGGVSYPGGLGWCDAKTGTVKTVSAPGDYNGVKIVTTDKPDFAFVFYDPPQSGLSTMTNPDLHPVCNGPLASCAPHIGALPIR